MEDKNKNKRLEYIEKPQDAMLKKKVDNEIEDELLDDTMYGETIPSLMGWISPEEQQKRANNLIEISKELSEEKDKKMGK